MSRHRGPRVACPLAYTLLSVAWLTGTAQGLAERALATCCVLWISSLAITLIRVASGSGVIPAPGMTNALTGGSR
jgi:hypothetical protein